VTQVYGQEIDDVRLVLRQVEEDMAWALHETPRMQALLGLSSRLRELGTAVAALDAVVWTDFRLAIDDG